MEKRTILFFILTFLLLFIWSQYFVPRPQIPVNDNKAVEEQTEEQSGSADQITSQAQVTRNIIPDNAEAAILPPSVAEKQIIVETPLYIATFSNRGPSLTYFKLKDYKTTIEPDSQPVELFTGQDHIKNHISFYFNNPYLKDENNLIFTTEGDSFVLSQGEANKDLSFKYVTSNGITVEQTFTFSAEQYDIGFKIKIKNQTGNIINGNIKAIINNMRPGKGGRYYSFTGAAAYFNNELNEFDFDDLEDNPELSGNIDWVAYENEYFLSAIIPQEKKDSKFSGAIQPSGIVIATHISPQVELAPDTEALKEYSLFLGPRDVKILEQFGNNLDKAIDYGFFSIIADPLHFTLNFFNRFLNNYGLSIILLTIIIKIIFWPLTQKSQKSMKEMQKLQPLMAKIREKYKDNREMMNKELMGLYRTYKVNPMSGCLPMLIQIPVFFALYRVLNNSIELRHAPFA
ncbi:MAG: membrane protein insertase YidC, partial [Desulfobacteraceae bacterium]